MQEFLKNKDKIHDQLKNNNIQYYLLIKCFYLCEKHILFLHYFWSFLILFLSFPFFFSFFSHTTHPNRSFPYSTPPSPSTSHFSQSPPPPSFFPKIHSSSMSPGLPGIWTEHSKQDTVRLIILKISLFLYCNHIHDQYQPAVFLCAAVISIGVRRTVAS